MTKEYIIRPTDAKEYITFQFKGLAQTLEQFDYPVVANIVRATQAIFDKSIPQQHTPPDCTLLDCVNKAK